MNLDRSGEISLAKTSPACESSSMWAILLLDGFRAYTEAIGFWAAVLTTIAFTPQVIRAWHTGGEGLSWTMLVLFATGVGLWFLYGVLRMSGPLMTANGLTGLQILVLLALKIRHARLKRLGLSSR
jgi:MtN3 and saliva related transmembrane protein